MNYNTTNQQPNMYYPPCPPPPSKESAEQKQKRATFFRLLFLPTLIYAALYVLFLYRNYSGITMPLFVIATGIYSFFCFKKLEIKRKPLGYVLLGTMLLFGISSFCTGNVIIITFNTIFIYLLLICFFIYHFYDVRKWDIWHYIGSIFCTLFGSLTCIVDPFLDGMNHRKLNRNDKKSNLLYVIIGMGIAIPLLILILALLSSADVVFRSVLSDFVQEINFLSIFGIVFSFIAVFFGAYTSMRYLGKNTIRYNYKDKRQFEPIIAITILILICLVYVIFSGIQILYLFVGNMELPDHYTYAEYAHEGFFQLLFVCILNLFIVLFVQAFFKKNIIQNILLTIISFCTYVMIASSAYRMYLYVRSYDLTFLRVLVFWALVLIALLLVGIIIRTCYDRFPFFSYSLVVFFGCYLILSFARVDYWIAKYNLTHAKDQTKENIDYDYLSRLSSDAAPALKDEDGRWMEKYIISLSKDTDDGIREWNLSHLYARHLFSEELEEQEQAFLIRLENHSASGIQNVRCCIEYEDGSSEIFDLEAESETLLSDDYSCTFHPDENITRKEGEPVTYHIYFDDLQWNTYEVTCTDLYPDKHSTVTLSLTERVPSSYRNPYLLRVK